jgi:ATP phosphoribosyltransferase
VFQIALPNKGGLSDEAVTLVREAGYACRRYGRELMVRDIEQQVDFVFLRPRDIAIYVGSGVLAMGITGRDLARDSEADVEELLGLGFGRSTFHYAVPLNSGITVADLAGRRIATSYPRLVTADLVRRGLDAEVVRLDGAVEISVRLGVADAIADVVQSGRTLYEAGLVPVGDPLVRSEAVVLARSRRILDDDAQARTFLERLQGIVTAREYVMVEYDVPETALEAACAITPGIESPTVAPLSRKGWMAVKAMTPRHQINAIMDRLAAAGAKGIIVTDIRTCRL